MNTGGKGPSPIQVPGAMLWIAAGILTLDQVSKAVALSLLPPGHFFLNTGAAFGILAGWRWPLVTAGLLAIFLAYRAARKSQGGQLAAWALGLMAGGAGANTLDRLIRGAVVDFLSVPGYPFLFNAADVALRLGGLLLLYAWFRPARPPVACGTTPRPN